MAQVALIVATTSRLCSTINPTRRDRHAQQPHARPPHTEADHVEHAAPHTNLSLKKTPLFSKSTFPPTCLREVRSSRAEAGCVEQRPGESRLTAAIPMANPRCSRRLSRAEADHVEQRRAVDHDAQRGLRADQRSEVAALKRGVRHVPAGQRMHSEVIRAISCSWTHIAPISEVIRAISIECRPWCVRVCVVVVAVAVCGRRGGIHTFRSFDGTPCYPH